MGLLILDEQRSSEAATAPLYHDCVSPVIANRIRKSKAIITIGIDLAKNVRAGHGVNKTGKPMLVKAKIGRADLFWLTLGRAIPHR